MAEIGTFRNAFRGFNKQDVLHYIEQMQASTTAALDDVHRRLRASEARVNELTASASANEKAAAEASAEAQALREQSDKLTALAQAYKRELLELRDKLAESEQRAEQNEELLAANARVAELEQENALLKEQNAQYARVVGDIHRVMMQARVVSASYFETAHKNSLECLGQLDSFLDDLKSQVASNMTVSSEWHRESGDRIDSLLSELKTD